MSRGLDNNNPGNLRRSYDKSGNELFFEGQVPNSTDPSFRQFTNMGYGYRALLKQLQSYVNNGTDTVSSIISKWAPASENDTNTYITDVENTTGIDRNKQISSDDSQSLISIASAISYHENGINAIISDVEAGWALLSGKKKLQ